MGINEINNLDTKEKITLMNKIWESLDKQSDIIETPKWHEEILKTRVAKMQRGEAKTISFKELKSR